MKWHDKSEMTVIESLIQKENYIVFFVIIIEDMIINLVLLHTHCQNIHLTQQCYLSIVSGLDIWLEYYLIIKMNISVF